MEEGVAARPSTARQEELGGDFLLIKPCRNSLCVFIPPYVGYLLSCQAFLTNGGDHVALSHVL